MVINNHIIKYIIFAQYSINFFPILTFVNFYIIINIKRLYNETDIINIFTKLIHCIRCINI